MRHDIIKYAWCSNTSAENKSDFWIKPGSKCKNKSIVFWICLFVTPWIRQYCEQTETIYRIWSGLSEFAGICESVGFCFCSPSDVGGVGRWCASLPCVCLAASAAASWEGRMEMFSLIHTCFMNQCDYSKHIQVPHKL